MNVKSRFASEEEEEPFRSSHTMRGGCGTPFSMISGPTRLDVTKVHAPKFIQWIFRAMGWKTSLDKPQNK
jgi:hypothetical protein